MNSDTKVTETKPTRRGRRALALAGLAVGLVLVFGAAWGLRAWGQADDTLARAQEALAAGDYAQAAEGFGRALENAPDDGEALAGQLAAAEALAQAGAWEAAGAAYEAAWRARPGETRALEGLGRVYAAQEKWAEAAGWYEKWTQVAPADGEAFVALGEAQFGQGAYEGAVAAYERAGALGVSSGELDFSPGVAYYELARYEEAIKALQGDIDQAAGDDLAEIYYFLGNSYFQVHDYEQAILFLEQAQALAPAGESARAEAARVHLEQARYVMDGVLLDLDFSDVVTDNKETFIIAGTGQKVQLKDGQWIVDASAQPSTDAGTIRVVVRPPGGLLWSDDSQQFNIVNKWKGDDQRFFIRKYTKDREPRLQYVIRNIDSYAFNVVLSLRSFKHQRYLDLVLVWDGNRAWVYLNGELLKGPTKVHIAGRWSTREIVLGGDLLQVTTLNRALTSVEIKAKFEQNSVNLEQ